MKIYDCFTYFDEKMLLNFRLNYLNNYVDKFVISEANYTHSGKPKKLNFNINDYPKFKDKIIYIPVITKPKGLHRVNSKKNDHETNSKLISNGYLRENFQRDQLQKGLQDANPNDFIIISDLDEIPNLEKINLQNIKEKIIFFKQKFLFYKFNLFYKNRSWYGSRACKKRFLLSPQWLRNAKSKQYSIFRLDILFSIKKYNSVFFVKDGGWHFTNLKTPKEIYYKFSNYLHHREFEHSNLSIKDINHMVKKNISIYNHEVEKSRSKFDGKIKLSKLSKKNLPNFLLKNLSLYKKWIIS
jgi:beta-1,4-mannosyl-glycoprotein beta-1,4-N-acetylglucosaminyltransferase